MDEGDSWIVVTILLSVEIIACNFGSVERIESIVDSIKNVVGVSGIVDIWVVIGDNEVE